MISAAPSVLPLVGRDAELAALAEMLDGETRGLVVVGEPGIGKTTLWVSGIAVAEERATRVLSAQPAAAETELSFAGLADLLDDVEPEVLEALPTPQRRALEVALLRVEPADAPPGPRAVAAAVLGVLNGLAARDSVLVAVDDVHCLDAASAQVLAFAARRLRDNRVRFLFARREGRTSELERAFGPHELVRLELTALSFGAVRTMLFRRGGLPLTRRMLRRVFEGSGGNPLFALELGRVLAERGAVMGDELPVPELVEDLVGARVASLPSSVRMLLTAVALNPDLRRAQLPRLADPDTIEAAVGAEALTLDEDRIRVGHPLLAAAARTRATADELRTLHRKLAGVVDDEELRARHLSLAAEAPDPKLAARVTAASQRAASRGAAGDAVDLAEHALRLTPPLAEERTDRLLTLAERLLIAGERARASELLEAEFGALPKGAAQARAHMLLAETDFLLMHVNESGSHLQRALEESAADPALHALANARWSRYLTAGRVERIEEAERCVQEALHVARRAGPPVEREVLHALAFARKLRGRPIDGVRERFAAVSRDAFSVLRGVDRIVADRLGTRGHIRQAREALRRLLALADERGEGWSAIWLLHQLCELELRAGEWEAASRLLAECDDSPDLLLLDPSGFERCRALLAAGRGDVEEAELRAARTIDVCKTRGLRWNLLEALRARGLAALLAHEPARAAEDLGAVWEHTERAGVSEPAEFPVAPDLVEALVELRRFDEASALTDRLRELAEEQEHPWGLASAARCEALLALARTREAGALDRLSDAAGAYERLGLRFDHARTLLAAGRGARRLRKWSKARDLVEQAAEAFERIGSEGWAADARAELGRIGGRRPAAKGLLTGSEQQVASLAAAGLSNKRIAEQLVVSVHTVERHLGHAYAKLGVESRSQLARRLAAQA